MIQKGKIARLPRGIRDKLNRRLSENEDGGSVLQWLNKLPAVKTLLAKEFGGAPINKQNLHAWRNSGFAEWQARQEMLEQASELSADARELTQATDGRLSDHLATVLSARYAALISTWNGEEDEAFRRKLRVLRTLSSEIVQLRRSDQHAAKLEFEQTRLDRDRDRTEEEVVEHFSRWVETEQIREVLLKNNLSPEDREREWRRIFGLPELKEPSNEPEESEEPEPEEQATEEPETVTPSVEPDGPDPRTIFSFPTGPGWITKPPVQNQDPKTSPSPTAKPEIHDQGSKKKIPETTTH